MNYDSNGLSMDSDEVHTILSTPAYTSTPRHRLSSSPCPSLDTLRRLFTNKSGLANVRALTKVQEPLLLLQPRPTTPSPSSIVIPSCSSDTSYELWPGRGAAPSTADGGRGSSCLRMGLGLVPFLATRVPRKHLNHGELVPRSTCPHRTCRPLPPVSYIQSIHFITGRGGRSRAASGRWPTSLRAPGSCQARPRTRPSRPTRRTGPFG